MALLSTRTISAIGIFCLTLIPSSPAQLRSPPPAAPAASRPDAQPWRSKRRKSAVFLRTRRFFPACPVPRRCFCIDTPQGRQPLVEWALKCRLPCLPAKAVAIASRFSWMRPRLPICGPITRRYPNTACAAAPPPTGFSPWWTGAAAATAAKAAIGEKPLPDPAARLAPAGWLRPSRHTMPHRPRKAFARLGMKQEVTQPAGWKLPARCLPCFPASPASA